MADENSGVLYKMTETEDSVAERDEIRTQM